MTDTRLTLVTGASRGIGYATALKLAEAGHHVIATARTQGGLEDLDDEIKKMGGQATLVPMDLKDFDAIDRLGAALHERFGRLDGLFGNGAQLGDMSPLPHANTKTWDDVIATNLTANFRLIRSLDPLLRLSNSGRVVMMSSSLAKSHLAYWGAYSVSKAGLEALTNIYANEVEITPIRVNILDPGRTRTAMRAKAAPGEDASLLPDPSGVAELAAKMLMPEWDAHKQCIRYQDISHA